MDGGGGGGLGPSSPLVDGGGSVRGWLLMDVCGGCWWVVMVLVEACRWCCWALDVGHRCCHRSLVAVGFQLLLFIVVCHCASFIGVVIIRHHFVSCGDVATDMSVDLPIGEG